MPVLNVSSFLYGLNQNNVPGPSPGIFPSATSREEYEIEKHDCTILMHCITAK